MTKNEAIYHIIVGLWHKSSPVSFEILEHYGSLVDLPKDIKQDEKHLVFSQYVFFETIREIFLDR